MANYHISGWTDEILLDLIRQENDRAAFAELYKRYFGLLYTFVHRKLKDPADAEDIIQEVFTSLWDKRGKLSISGRVAPYLYASIRNRMLDFIGRKGVEGRYLASLNGVAQAGVVDSDHRARERQLSYIIEKEIDNLPPKMREVFLLSRRDHMSYKEIAEKLNISEQSVRSHVKNALRLLRTRLGMVTYLVMLIKNF